MLAVAGHVDDDFFGDGRVQKTISKLMELSSEEIPFIPKSGPEADVQARKISLRRFFKKEKEVWHFEKRIRLAPASDFYRRISPLFPKMRCFSVDSPPLTSTTTYRARPPPRYLAIARDLRSVPSTVFIFLSFLQTFFLSINRYFSISISTSSFLSFPREKKIPTKWWRWGRVSFLKSVQASGRATYGDEKEMVSCPSSCFDSQERNFFFLSSRFLSRFFPGTEARPIRQQLSF